MCFRAGEKYISITNSHPKHPESSFLKDLKGALKAAPAVYKDNEHFLSEGPESVLQLEPFLNRRPLVESHL